MQPWEHYLEAERLLNIEYITKEDDLPQLLIARAQVHAILANVPAPAAPQEEE